MKRSIKFYSVALAALMVFASLAFVSCDKENDVVNPQNERVTKSDVNDPYTFPIHEMNFTDQNNTIWTAWGSYKLLGRRGIKFDIKFHHALGTVDQPVDVIHFVGTVHFDLNGNCTIDGNLDHRWTTEIKDFLHDFAIYWLHH